MLNTLHNQLCHKGTTKQTTKRMRTLFTESATSQEIKQKEALIEKKPFQTCFYPFKDLHP